MSNSLHELAIWLAVSIIAITFHEAGHAIVAYWRGDKTAYLMGRVSLNPARHIDPVGTIILPAALFLMHAGIMFGWAKPVLVNYRNLKGRFDSALVSFAGPLMNLILALLSVMGLKVMVMTGSQSELMLTLLANSLQINVVFAVFNLIPIPPLDGSKIIMPFLPRAWAIMLARLERHGLIIIMSLLFFLPMVAKSTGLPINPVTWLIAKPAGWLIGVFLNLFGLG